MNEQKRPFNSPVANLVHTVRHSFRARISLVTLSGAVLGIVLAAVISVVGIHRLALDALRQIETGLGATTRAGLENRIETTAALVNARMDHAQADLRILADITQKLIDHREEFRPLTEAATRIPFFEDKMVYHPEGRYSQNAPDEPAVVTIQHILHDESFQLKPYPQQILDETAMLDLVMPSIHTYGAKKTWTYFVGGEGASFLRMTPWTDFGKDTVEIYPEQMDVSYWSFFPGLIDAWEKWLRDPDSAADRPSDVTSTQPVIDGASGTTIQIFGHPLWNRERTGFAGAVWYDLQLDDLTEMITEIELAETGFAFLALADGNVIAISERGLQATGLAGTEYIDEGMSLYRYLANSREPAIAELALPESDDVQTLDVRLDGRDYVLMMRRMAPLTGFRDGSDHTWVEHWTLGFVIPKDEIYAPLTLAQGSIERSSRIILAGQGIVLVATILALMSVTYLFSERMTRGLANLSASTREIRQGNYDARVTVESEDEIGELGAAFNEMAEQLRTSFEQVAQQNVELRAEVLERQRAEEAQRRSEVRLRTITNTTPTYIYELDAEGLIRFANRVYEGVTRDQVVGTALADWFPEPQRPMISELIERVFATGKTESIEYTIPNPQGEPRSYDAQITPVLVDGQVEGAVLTANDITERVQAEEALRQSEARYSLLVETIPHGVQLVDFSGDILYSNLAGETILGYTKDDPYKTIFDFQPSGTARHAMADFLAYLAEYQPPPTSYEIEAVRKDGQSLDLSIDWDYIRDETGQATGFVSILTDITERLRAEETLRFLSSIVEQVQDAVIVTGLDQRITYVNKAAEELFGYSQQELAGEMAEILNVQPLSARALQDIDKAISQGSVWSSEHLNRKKDGSVFPCELRISPLIDEQGQICGYIGVQHDITERKRAEEERERLLAQVQQQARRVQQIVDTVPEGVLLLDADERVVQANPMGERDLVNLAGGARVGDVLTRLGDRPLAKLLTSPPQGLWHEVTADEQSLQAIARPIEMETADGGWVLVIRDVTQQREIQRRIQQQERLAAVGQLAAGIAHDFNNILATVVLYAQLTGRETGLPAHVRQRMDTINQQAGHASNLIQQILDFGRRAMLERRPLDLALLLQEHTGLLKRTLPESIALTLTHEPDEYLVGADPTRMQQMVTNLALNARDAMPAGGVLSIHLERLAVDDELEIVEGAKIARKLPPEITPGEWIRIRIADTGTGIPPDVLPRIFEPFYTTKAPLGSGLGLAQVHGIVAQHEGVIDVASQPDQGTTFIIYLPALRLDQSESSTPAARAELPPLPWGQGETILVVEDDPVVRQTLMESLEMLNYRTLEAVNGYDALQILETTGEKEGGEEGEIALILSDVVMPGMGGIALLHTLRERGSTVKVIMLTGHPLQQELEELQAQGMIAWLPKPPRLEELAETIARVLREGEKH